MSIKPEEFEEYWGYKYVCFEDGTVLFCDAASTSHSHKQLVDERPNLKAISAGKIKVREKKWQMGEGGSMTAKLPSLAGDEAMIDKVLKPFGYSMNDGEYWYF